MDTKYIMEIPKQLREMFKNKKSNDTRDNRNPRDSRDTKAPKKSRGSFKERQAAKNRRSR